MLNFKTSVDAFHCLTEPKNVELFTEFGIMSSVELNAREEILFENYSKVIDIEAKTMVDIANRKIIPAIEKYVAELTATAKDKLEVFGASAPVALERRLIGELSLLADTAYATAEKLKNAAVAADGESDCKASAFAYKDKVIPLMASLRAAVDKAETVVPTDIWPLPCYGDMTLKQ